MRTDPADLLHPGGMATVQHYPGVVARPSVPAHSLVEESPGAVIRLRATPRVLRLVVRLFRPDYPKRFPAGWFRFRSWPCNAEVCAAGPFASVIVLCGGKTIRFTVIIIFDLISVTASRNRPYGLNPYPIFVHLRRP